MNLERFNTLAEAEAFIKARIPVFVKVRLRPFCRDVIVVTIFNAFDESLRFSQRVESFEVHRSSLLPRGIGELYPTEFVP